MCGCMEYVGRKQKKTKNKHMVEGLITIVILLCF